MVTREHLYLLMARNHEISLQLCGLDFGDVDKNQLRDELVRYAQSIYSLSIDRVNTENRDLHARLSIYLTQMMTCLEASHQHPINVELEYVVGKLASEWNIDQRTNIILFSRGNFAVRHYDALVFKALEQLYHTALTKHPRIVYFPREYDGDYIFSSVVFHEVGHMVENDRNLGGKVYDELIKEIKDKPRSKILKDYFRLDYDKPEKNESRLRAYIREYIADIFGSQYLGIHILHYLNCHESQSRKTDTGDHPCFECREKMVSSFMDYVSRNPYSTSDKLLQIIVDVFHNEVAIPDLASRDINLNNANIVRGNAIVVTDCQELFSLFSATWRSLLCGISSVEASRGMAGGTLTRYDYYDSINKATRQSIRDYMLNNP